jgi:hypothetical protein
MPDSLTRCDLRLDRDTLSTNLRKIVVLSSENGMTAIRKDTVIILTRTTTAKGAFETHSSHSNEQNNEYAWSYLNSHECWTCLSFLFFTRWTQNSNQHCTCDAKIISNLQEKKQLTALSFESKKFSDFMLFLFSSNNFDWNINNSAFIPFTKMEVDLESNGCDIEWWMHPCRSRYVLSFVVATTS